MNAPNLVMVAPHGVTFDLMRRTNPKWWVTTMEAANVPTNLWLDEDPPTWDWNVEPTPRRTMEGLRRLMSKRSLFNPLYEFRSESEIAESNESIRTLFRIATEEGLI